MDWTSQVDVPVTLVVGKFRGKNGGCCRCEVVSEGVVGSEDGSAVGVGVGKASTSDSLAPWGSCGDRDIGE